MVTAAIRKGSGRVERVAVALTCSNVSTRLLTININGVGRLTIVRPRNGCPLSDRQRLRTVGEVGNTD